MKTGPTFGFIVGASGGGKGFCIGSPLAEFYGVDTFVTGDWCRSFRKNEANNGVMVNDDLINAAVTAHFKENQNDFYLIDAPRSREQVYFFMEMFRNRLRGCKLVTIHMVTTYDQSVRLIKHRAERQRRYDDAKPEAVRKRLEAYFSKGGIFETVIPILQEHTDYHRVEHQGFDDPLNVEDNHIDAVLEQTRIPVRERLGLHIFGHPSVRKPIATK